MNLIKSYRSAYNNTVLSGQALRLATTALCTSVLLASPAIAGPEGGSVTSGDASISQNATKTDIHQNSNRAIIDWRSFNVQNNEHVEFHQPSSNATTLNRVNAANPSQIDGRITANGNVIIVNPNGVFFGNESHVDVNSLVATSSDIRNQDFMAGQGNFDISGSADAKIINAGTIKAKDAGLVGLVAPQVENSGVIEAKLGTVQLASGDTFELDLYGDGLISVSAIGDLHTQLVQNTNAGVIKADGGTVKLTAAAARNNIDNMIINEGALEAKSLSQKNGVITLGNADQTASYTGTSTTLNKGVIDVSGTDAGESGGYVEIRSDHIGVTSGAKIIANGESGGGTIHIGGAYQGKGTGHNAEITIIEQDAVIEANATHTGNGGEVILWADDTTYFQGSIEARGGDVSGDGGFVETSGKDKLIATGFVDASSPHGEAGQWLLDPNNITIQDSGSDTNITASPSFTSTDDSAIVTTSSIETALNGGTSVTVQTASSGGNAQDGNITLKNNIEKTSGGDASLTLQAHNSIFVNADITSTTGALDVTLHADSDNSGAGAIAISNATINTNNGDIIAGGGINPLLNAATGTAANNDGIVISNSTLSAGTGDISVRGTGRDASTSYQLGVYLVNNSTVTTTTGDIAITGNGGDGTSNNYGTYIRHSATQVSSTDGNVTITGTGGNGSSSSNYGIVAHDGATIRSTGAGASAGTLTFNGTGGDGTSSNLGTYIYGAGTKATSVDGDITITGTGGNGSSTSNHGVYVNVGAQIISSGTGANAANITLNGYGGVGTTTNYGTIINGSGTTITSIDGDITITGAGADTPGQNNYGLYILGGAKISSTGSTADAAKIMLNGTGGDGTSRNIGTYLTSVNTEVTSITGDISVTGIGGNGSTSRNYGVWLNTGSQIHSTGTGSGAAKVTILGTGGDGTSGNHGTYINGSSTEVTSIDGDITLTGTANGTTSSNYGVLVNTGSKVKSSGVGTDAATITIAGTTTNGSSSNIGAYINGVNTEIEAVDGDVTITGTGGNGTSDNNYGTYINTGSKITSTGVGANASNITLTGFGGDGRRYNYGTYINGAATHITSVDGNIGITGTGGDGSGNANHGIYVRTGANISSTGVGSNAAMLTFDGTGGIGTSSNYGTHFAGAGIKVTSIDGDIDITGTGGDGSSTSNIGIYATSGVEISSTGTTADAATITFDGTGGTGTGTGYGTYLNGAGTKVSSVIGDIYIQGLAGSSSGRYERGLLVNTGAQIISSGTGANAATITLIGTGGDGSSDNYGTYINGAGTKVSSVDGDIIITGDGGNGTSNRNYGINVSAGAEINSTGTTSDAATVTLNGAGGDGTSTNYGVHFTGVDAKITSVIGDINVTGTGGNGSSTSNYGILFNTGSKIQSTGTGADAATITLTGSGGAGTGSDFGAYINGAATEISTIDGDILINGTGGPNGHSNYGALINTGAKIISSGTGTNAATININGTGGDGVNNNYGTYINGAGTKISSVDGDIDIVAIAGDSSGRNNRGFIVGGGAEISSSGTNSDAATITLMGTGADGTSGNYGAYITGIGTKITSAYGNIDLDGVGGDGSTSSNYGLHFTTGAQITSTGSGANAATLTLNGTGGDGTSSNHGVVFTGVDAAVESVDGNINLTGVAGNGSTSSNYGVIFSGGSRIKSAGNGAEAASITVTGTGGSGTNSNTGVYTANTGTEFTSVDGDISVTGTSNATGKSNYGLYIVTGSSITSTGTGSDAGEITLAGTGADGTTQNYGIYLNGAGAKVSTVDGDLSITGNGGHNSGAHSRGVIINSAAEVSSTGVGTDAATVTINATGNTGTSSNFGLQISGVGSRLNSVDGDIHITATAGNGSGASNFGTYITTDSSINSTGTGSNAAKIKLITTGGDGTSGNYGLLLSGIDAGITTVDGDIDVLATAGNGSTSNNRGAYINTGSKITSSGTGEFAGDITLVGIGGNGTSGNYGTFLNGVGAKIASIDGDINISGTGGNGSSSSNYGTHITTGAEVTSTGTGENAGTITINGTGGDGTSNNVGVYVLNSTALVASVDGDIDITGTGGNGSINSNHGLYLRNAADVISTGDADISLTGVQGANTSKDIRISGTGVTVGGADADGNITLTLDNYNLFNSPSFQTNGDITVQARSTNTSVGVVGGAGDLQINDTFLGYLNEGGSLIFGRTDSTADLTVNAKNWGTRSVELRTGEGTIDLLGSQTNLTDFTLTSDANPMISGMLTGTGVFTLQPSSASTSIGLGGGAGTLNFSDARLDQITDGWSELVFGNDTMAGATNVETYAWNDDVRFVNDGDTLTSAINIIGEQITAGNTNLIFDGDTILSANITASGGNIQFNNAATLADDILITSNGGDIALDGAIFDDGSSRDLTLALGSGSFSNAGEIGTAASALSTVTITSDAGLTINNGIYADDINLTTDGDIALNGALTGTGMLSIRGQSANTSIGLGGGAGTLNLADGELDHIASGWNEVVFGDASMTAAMNIGAYDNWSNATTFRKSTLDMNNGITINGAQDFSAGGNAAFFGDVHLGGDIATGANSLIFNNNVTLTGNTSITGTAGDIAFATGLSDDGGMHDISINTGTGFFTQGGAFGSIANTFGALSITSASTLTYDYGVHAQNIVMQTTNNADIAINDTLNAYGAGNAIVIATDGNLINTAGSGALNTPSGRFLIYADDPTFITPDGINANKQYNTTYSANTANTITGTDNKFLYEYAATLFLDANNASREYGLANPAFTYSHSGLVFGDDLATALGGTPALYSSAGLGDNVGTYDVSLGAGTISNPFNYNIMMQNGDFEITKAPLTITANSFERLDNEPNPTFTYQATGFRNGQDDSILLTPVELMGPASTAAAGAHAITPFNATAQNYDITFVNGVLDVNTSLSDSLGSVVSSPGSSGQIAAQSKSNSNGPQAISRVFTPRAENVNFKTDRIYISAKLSELLGWEDQVSQTETNFENLEIISINTPNAQ